MLRFFARLSRFGARTCSSKPSREAPGLYFRARNGCFFEVFSREERATRKTSDINKTLVGAVREPHRSYRATCKKRSKMESRAFCVVSGATNGPHARPGASRARFGATFDAFFVALGASWAPQERSWRALGASWARLGTPRACFLMPWARPTRFKIARDRPGRS